MDGANSVMFLEMHHMIKDALDTKNLGPKIEPNRNKNSNEISFMLSIAIMEENHV